MEDRTLTDEELEAKRLKKEAKKARKEKKRGAEEMETDGPAESEIASVPTEECEVAEEDEESKRRRKEEKKARKEAKRLKEMASTDSMSSNESTVSFPSETAPKAEKQKPASAPAPSSINNMAQDMEIKVYPEEHAELYRPYQSFDDMNSFLVSNGTPAEILKTMSQYVSNKGFAGPSPIQSYCWPPSFSGQDVIGIASTGSGKTLAFLFPALAKLAAWKKANPSSANKFNKNGNHNKPSPKVLVLAPTRELAMQSYQVTLDVGNITSVCVYGGVSKQQQMQEMRTHQSSSNGLDIVIATPGRLLDFIEENTMTLSEVLYLVLDEADRMLDEGFEPAIRRIISGCPGCDKRQTVMLSATWPEEIRALADKYLNAEKTTRIVVGSDELSANHRVTQIVELMENNSRAKDQKLLQLLEKYHKGRTNKILIFVLYKREAVVLQNTIQSRGFNVTAIHGDKSQYDRTDALEAFRSGTIPLLIATDVAARGLDIPNVEYVINYSFPLTVEDYVHRIGRTGRAGKTGTAHTFFTDFDKGLAGGLVGVLQEANQPVPQEIYKYPMITKKKESKLYGAFGPKDGASGKKATKITFDE